MVSLEFFSGIILPVVLWPWGRLSLQQKWLAGLFPGGKGGRYVRLTTFPPSCAVVMMSGNLNFQEISGPLSGLKRDCFTLFVNFKLFVCTSLIWISVLNLYHYINCPSLLILVTGCLLHGAKLFILILWLFLYPLNELLYMDFWILLLNK